MFLLCLTDNLMVLERYISKRYKEIPADLFGVWEKRTFFFFSDCSIVLSLVKCILTECKLAGF